MEAGACGWSAQVLGADSVQRDYDGTPMVTDLMTDDELLAFARVLGERDEGSIELAYSATGIADEISEMPDTSKRLFERLAEVSNRPIIHQAVVSFDHDSEQHRTKLKWLEDCANRGLRVYGQGIDPQVRKGADIRGLEPLR